MGTQRGKEQWRDSVNPALDQCITSGQSVCPKYLNEVAVLSQCTTASALVMPYMGWLHSGDAVGLINATDLPLLSK